MNASPKVLALTSQFYEWEILGRGWLYGEGPVELEPPFTPFFGHFIKNKQTPVDDGLHHTLASRVASLFKQKRVPEVIKENTDVSYELFPFEDDDTKIIFRFQLSKASHLSASEIEHFLSMLSYCQKPSAFEIVGTEDSITISLTARSSDAPYIKSQLKTYFKNTSFTEEMMIEQDLVDTDLAFATVDFGLKEEFMRPLAYLKNSSIDPFRGLFSILEHLEYGERLVYQVLFNGTLNYWPGSILKSVSDAKGGPFFEDAPDMLPLAKEKISSPLFAVSVRMLAQAHSLDDAFSVLQKGAFALINNTRTQANSLVPLSQEGYTASMRAMDIAYRESHRLGMLLNLRELSTFIHIPEPSLLSKKILKAKRKTKASPSHTETGICEIGLNEHQGIIKKVFVSETDRIKHTHIIGATGTGKSTLLLQMICADINAGRGIAVLDPHGDLIDSILSSIPKNRAKDVVIIDPSDSEYPVSCNILKAHSESEKEILSSDLVAAFRKNSTSWGDQMNSVFANAILAFLESPEGGTLADIRRFLIEKDFREQFLKTVSDPSIKYYWQKEYPLLKTNSVGPILTRLDTFLRPRLIRNMVCQKRGLDFESIINGNKILLIKLSQGLIGTENSYLLGSFIVSKIHQIALSRQAQNDRPNFYVYIDEFQHFITPSMAHILSGARKYHVGLILAHQDIQQASKADSEVLHTLLSNAGTRICFRLSETDAKKMAEGFSSFESADLQNLHTGEAIARLERPEYDFSLATVLTEKNEDCATKEEIITFSRTTYSIPRDKVEESLYKQLAFIPEEPPAKEVSKPIKETKQILHTDKASVQETSSISDTSKQDVVVAKRIQSQHRYLQSLIKKVAESKGYKAIIEMPTPDGTGSVDVCLEGHGRTIAVEVSVTTDATWELHNVQKCIAAGYSDVFVCCTEEKSIPVLKKKITDSDIRSTGITIGTADQLMLFLDSFAKDVPVKAEETIKGYRVKIDYESLPVDDAKRKRESIAKIVLETMRKKNK